MDTNEREKFTLELSGETPIISPRFNNPKTKKQSGWHMLVYSGQIGISILVPLLLGVGIGKYVDTQQHSGSRYVLIGLGIGFLLSLLTLISTVREIITQSKNI